MAPPARRKLSLLWWLPFVFGGLVALSVILASEITRSRSQDALRERAEDLAAGRSFRAARGVGELLDDGVGLPAALTRVERDERLTALVLGPDGTSLTPMTPARAELAANPSTASALATLQTRDRFINADAGPVVSVALRLRAPTGAIMVTASSRSTLNDELGIVTRARRDALLIALPLSVLAGIAVAILIAFRIRRVATAATVIAGGELGRSISPGFPDEIGQLAGSFDRMRTNLQASFTQIDSERRRLRVLLSRLHQGVIVIDEDLRIVYANAAAARIASRLDVSEGEVLPDPWHALPLQAIAGMLFVEGALLTRRRETVEEGREIEVVGIPPGHRGEETAILVITDLSVEARRERAERDFVANAAHELRTPLSTIIGSVDVLLGESGTRERDRDRFLGHIRREALRLNRLSHSLLVLARAQAGVGAGSTTTIRLKPLLDDIVAGIEPKAGVALTMDCPDDLQAVGDPDLLEQAVFNIVANAVAHTDAGSVSLDAARSDDRCTITVTDTGRGIAPEERERIFERFYRAGETSPGRFGLGLAIARSCTEALGGELEIASTPGVGTTALISLPDGDRTKVGIAVSDAARGDRGAG